MNKHIALVSDGQEAQVLAILMVVNELIQKTPEIQERATIWVGFPIEYHENYKCYFRTFEEYTSIKFFHTNVNGDDRYFVKLGLVDLLEQLPAEDEFLYLDYDHLVLEPLKFEFTNPDCIQVSSEVQLNGESCHYNNSFMFSRVSTMREVTRQWLEVYDSLEGIKPEKREETAFNLAAHKLMRSLLPVNYDIQNNLAGAKVRDTLTSHKGDRNSSLFHYGGQSSVARQLKEYLKTLASEFEWEHFTIDKLNADHKKMIDKLYKNLSD